MFPYSPLRFDQWHALYHQPPRLIDPQLLPELSLSLSYVVKNIPLWYCKLSPGIQMNKNWNKGFFIDDCFLNYHCYNEPKSFRIHCKQHKRRKKTVVHIPRSQHTFIIVNTKSFHYQTHFICKEIYENFTQTILPNNIN